jgi:hypothetical protein
MSRFASRQQLLEEVTTERRKLEALLSTVPAEARTEEVTEGLSVKDLLAHRTEWGRMMLSWYTEAKAGGTPAVPSASFKWNQLSELNAEIHARFRDTSLAEIEAEFTRVHDELFDLISQLTDEELFTKKYYPFTGSSDLAAYFNSATAAHYRSAAKLIRKWWKERAAAER